MLLSAGMLLYFSKIPKMCIRDSLGSAICKLFCTIVKCAVVAYKLLGTAEKC